MIDHVMLSHIWRQINAQWYKHLNQLLVENSLTHTDRMVLMATKALEHPTKSDLASAINVRPQSLTRSIERLSQNGLLTKIENDQDKRYVRLELTPKSKSIIKLLEKHNVSLWGIMSEGISKENMKIFSTCLEKMVINLKRGETHGT